MALVNRLRELEARRRAIDDDLRNVQPVPRWAPEVIESRLAEWRRLLRQSVTQGRAVLQRVLVGRITLRQRARATRLRRPRGSTGCLVARRRARAVCQTCGEEYVDEAMTQHLLDAVAAAERAGVQVESGSLRRPDSRLHFRS